MVKPLFPDPTYWTHLNRAQKRTYTGKPPRFVCDLTSSFLIALTNVRPIILLLVVAAPISHQTAAKLDELMRNPAPIYARQADAGVIRALEQDGCRFSGSPATGLSLEHVGLGCYGDYLAWAADCTQVEVYQSTSSTQDACRRLLSQTGPKALGAVVVSDEQSAGRGRLGRRWHAPSGSAALFSAIVPLSQTNPERLALTAAVAVADTIAAALVSTGHRPAIKWPNDTLVNSRKIAGILIETASSQSTPSNKNGPEAAAAIIGIGINIDLDPAQLAANADTAPLAETLTSLRQLGSRAHRLQIIADTLKALHQAIQTPTDALLARWRSRCKLLDQTQSFMHDGQTITGHVIDLDPDEGLALRTQEGAIVHLPAATTSTKL